MAKNKTLELIGSMSVHDKKAFEAYLASPFFNCSDEVIRLYQGLDSRQGSAGRGKEALFSMIYPKQEFDDKLLRYIISELNKHLIHYFTLRQLDKSPMLITLQAANALAKRDCEKAYMLVHHEIDNSGTFRNASWYYSRFEHAEQHLIYTANKLNRKATPDYSDTLNYLDTFYIIKKLQLGCEVVNLSNVLRKEYHIAMLDAVMALASTKPYSDIPSVKIYQGVFQMLTHSEADSHYAKVETLLKDHASAFHPGELGEMYQYLKNYCVGKVNRGDLGYLETLFNLYRSILSNKLLMNHDYLSQWEFKNIVSISLRLNEKSWCEKFILAYIRYLKPGERVNALAYNQAYLWFINNDFHKAIRKLQEVDLNDVFYQLDARVILLKSYYELDETESFFYQASAFRLFLLRNRYISEYQKNIYRNLIKFLTAIVRANGSRTKLKRIITEIEQERNVADLNWLLTKAEDALL